MINRLFVCMVKLVYLIKRLIELCNVTFHDVPVFVWVIVVCFEGNSHKVLLVNTNRFVRSFVFRYRRQDTCVKFFNTGKVSN